MDLNHLEMKIIEGVVGNALRFRSLLCSVKLFTHAHVIEDAIVMNVML